MNDYPSNEINENKIPSVDDVQKMMFDLIIALRTMRPEGKSEVARRFAICITEAEKLNSFFEWYIATQFEFPE